MAIINPESASLRPLPKGQNWLIKKGKKLGYFLGDDSSDIGGICFAYTQMARQAILARDFERFCARLQIIRKLQKDELEDEIKWAKRVMSRFTKEAKFEILQEMGNGKFNDFYQWLEASEKDKDESEKKEIEKKVYADVKSRIEKKLRLSMEPELRHDFEHYLEIESFFEGLQIYQKNYRYPWLFDEPLITKQSETQTTPLLMPKIMEEEGGIAKVDIFSGMYSRAELIDYFETFRLSLEKLQYSQPVTLILRGPGVQHAFLVTFDTDENIKKWILSNANAAPAEVLSSDEAVAERAMAALYCTNQVSFTTEMHVSQSSVEQAEGLKKTWHEQQKWQAIHEITSQKIKVDDQNASWLHSAIRINDSVTVTELIKIGANVNSQTNIHGASPLYRAVEIGNKEIVELLLANKADANLLTRDGVSPLHRAVEKGDKKIVELLLTNEADANLQTRDGAAPLHRAVEKGDEEILQLLLTNGADANLQTRDGVSPLHRAVEKGDENIVQSLLAGGADANLQKNKNGGAPLHRAVEKGNENIVELLLAGGADINLLTRDGIAPLQRAIQAGHYESINILLNHGADCHMNFTVAVSDLFKMANKQHRSKEIEALLKASNKGKVPINISQFSSLELAVFAGRADVVKMLLEHADLTENFGKAIIYAQTLKNDDILFHLEQAKRLQEIAHLLKHSPNNIYTDYMDALNTHKKVIENAGNIKDLLRELNGFKTVDNLTQNLRNIAHNDSLPLEIKIDITEIMSMAYRTYSASHDIELCVINLEKNIENIREKVRAAIDQSSKRSWSSFFTQKRGVIEDIDAVIHLMNKGKRK